MLPEYVVIVIFALAAAFAPLSLILSSRLIRFVGDTNEVARLNYESGEESVGSRITIMSEYMHYFTSFLAFEVIGAVMLLWAIASEDLGFYINVAAMVLFFAAFALSLLPILLARRSLVGRGAG